MMVNWAKIDLFATFSHNNAIILYICGQFTYWFWDWSQFKPVTVDLG